MCGEVSEWFKEPVLKTGDPATGHGFESHPLRQNKTEGCGAAESAPAQDSLETFPNRIVLPLMRGRAKCTAAA